MTELANTIVSVITSVGFPIAMCLLVFWRMNKQDDAHRAEVKELTLTIAENTKALTAIQQLIEDKL